MLQPVRLPQQSHGHGPVPGSSRALPAESRAGALGQSTFYGLLAPTPALQMALGSQRDATVTGGADQNLGQKSGSLSCLRADVAPTEQIHITSKHISQHPFPCVYNSLSFIWMPERIAKLASSFPNPSPGLFCAGAAATLLCNSLPNTSPDRPPHVS